MEEPTEPVARIRARIDTIYSTQSVQGEDGVTYSIVPVSIPPDRGQFLLDICRAERAVNTLEIGMAWGLSTLHILQGLLENGLNQARHVVIDPWEAQIYHNAALRILRELGIDRNVEFYPEPSGIVLPRLAAHGRRFDLAFIDGDHKFDSVFIDLFYVDQLLKPGGVALFDDMGWDGVHLACRFAETNYGYESIGELPRPKVSEKSGRPVIRAYRKPLEPIERDQFHFVPFFDNFVSNRFGSHLNASSLRFQGLTALRDCRRAQARRYFCQALALEPLHLKTYFRLLRTFLPMWLVRPLSGRIVRTPR